MLKQIPEHEKIEFKEKFIERYKSLTDFEIFKKYSLSFLRRSIRVNTLKISVNDLKERLKDTWNLNQIPWIEEGFWIENKISERRDIGNLIEHFLGYFYCQEAASMLPAFVLEPNENDIVLDMAASPGSKSTHIAALMKNKGLLLANDYTPLRMKPLTQNLQRCSVTNALTTLMLGQRIKNMQFDKILLDAPCSGTGTIRKSLKTLRIWNDLTIKRLAGTQRHLISAAFELLKYNGILVYSTCSLEPEENEEIIDYLLFKHKNAELIDINIKNIKKSAPVLEFGKKKYDNQIAKCLRIWPQDNDTEGFFIAKILKTES